MSAIEVYAHGSDVKNKPHFTRKRLPPGLSVGKVLHMTRYFARSEGDNPDGSLGVKLWKYPDWEAFFGLITRGPNVSTHGPLHQGAPLYVWEWEQKIDGCPDVIETRTHILSLWKPPGPRARARLAKLADELRKDLIKNAKKELP